MEIVINGGTIGLVLVVIISFITIVIYLISALFFMVVIIPDMLKEIKERLKK